MKNYEIYKNFEFNELGFPVLEKQKFKRLPVEVNLCAYREKLKYPALVHFFLDDFRFESVWNAPGQSLRYLRKEQVWAVFSPDFSLYPELPLVVQLHQVFKSRVVSRYYQSQGLNVIPTVSWSDSGSLAFCFKGIPENQILALEIPGQLTKSETDNFYSGYQDMIQQLRPSAIFCFGSDQPLKKIDQVPKYYFPKGHFFKKTSNPHFHKLITCKECD